MKIILREKNKKKTKENLAGKNFYSPSIPLGKHQMVINGH